MNPVVFFGYQGRKLEEVQSAILKNGAVLVDIRYSPRSRAPMWNRRNLEALLGPAHYVWKGDTLGNRLYRTDDIEIADLPVGLEELAFLAAERPLLVMCVCPSPVGCHRTVIREALETLHGVPTRECGAHGLESHQP